MCADGYYSKVFWGEAKQLAMDFETTSNKHDNYTEQYTFLIIKNFQIIFIFYTKQCLGLTNSNSKCKNIILDYKLRS